MNKRMTATVRKEDILTAAVKVAERDGYSMITRENIALKAGCSPGLINHYFTTMTKLRRAIMRRAIRDEIYPIIAYGIATKDPQALKAPICLREHSLHLAGQFE